MLLSGLPRGDYEYIELGGECLFERLTQELTAPGLQGWEFRSAQRSMLKPLSVRDDNVQHSVLAEEDPLDDRDRAVRWPLLVRTAPGMARIRALPSAGLPVSPRTGGSQA
jgi:hypothetical protein